MTALWSASDLAAATGGRLNLPFVANGVSIDSRTVKADDLFVALADQRDGHAFVAEALRKRAGGALVSRVPEGLAPEPPLLIVADTLAGLTDLGAFARARFAGRVIAVTGSVGKTTTKEMLKTILAAHGDALAAEASYNNHWGVPLTLARLAPDADFCVIEIGMNHAGEIAPLARLARPDVAVVVSVEHAHVGHLGSLDAIAVEKASIASGLSAGGIAILPGDHPLLSVMRDIIGVHAIRLFGAGDNCGARLVSFRPDADGSEVVAEIEGETTTFRLNAPGRHMAMNAVAALAGAAALGIAPASAAAALAGFSPMSGRGLRRAIKAGDGEAMLLDESYNASSASVRAALSVLALQPAARRIAVLGDMLELGDYGVAEHTGLADAVTASIDLLFTCGPLMANLCAAVPVSKRGAHAADSAALAPLVAARLRRGDVVLVKGSLGSRMKRIVDALAPAPAAERA